MEASQGAIPAEISAGDDPPTNGEGQYICSRACADGSRCLATVPFPYFTCYQHPMNEPVIEAETRSTE